MPRPSDMISGGTLQSLAAVAGGEDAAAVDRPGGADHRPGQAPRRSAAAARSRWRRAAARGGAVIAPMAPAAFINPAVIQRTAALRAERGDGRAVSLPRGDGARGSAPRRFRCATRWRACSRARRPALGGRRACAAVGEADVWAARCARSCRRPGSGRPATASRSGSGACRSTRGTTGGPRGRGSTSTPTAIPGYLATAQDARRGGAAAGRARRHAGARWMPDAGDGARHGDRSSASSGRGFASRSAPEPWSAGPQAPAPPKSTQFARFLCIEGMLDGC